MLVEILLGVFWATTYVLVIAYSIRYRSEKKVFMPFICGALNLGWEVLALQKSGGYWVHIVWLLLDCIIFAYNVYILGALKKRLIYLLLTASFFSALLFVFSLDNFDGMLISSFAIDIVISVEYLIMVKRLSFRGQIIIAVFRILGDFFAWYANKSQSKFVLIAGVIIIVLNFAYLFICIKFKKKRTDDSKSPKKQTNAKRRR